MALGQAEVDRWLDRYGLPFRLEGSTLRLPLGLHDIVGDLTGPGGAAGSVDVGIEKDGEPRCTPFQ